MIEIKFSDPGDLEKIVEESRGKESYAIAQLRSPSVFDPLEYVYFTSTSRPVDEDADKFYQLRSTIIFTSPKKGIAVPKLSDDYSSTIYTPRGNSSASLFVKSEKKNTGIEMRFKADKHGDAYTTSSEEFKFENFEKYLASLVYITEHIVNDLYMRSGLEKTTMFDNAQMIITPGGVYENYEDAAETGLAPVDDEDLDAQSIRDDLGLHKSPETIMRQIFGPPTKNSLTSIDGGGKKTFHSRMKRKEKDGEKRKNPFTIIRFDEEDKK